MFTKAKLIIEVKAKQAGYIQTLEAKTLGIVSMKLGGGRQTKDDVIDHSVGIILNKKVGDQCKVGEVFAWILAYIHANNEVSDELINELYGAYKIVDFFVEKPILIDEILV